MNVKNNFELHRNIYFLCGDVKILLTSNYSKRKMIEYNAIIYNSAIRKRSDI